MTERGTERLAPRHGRARHWLSIFLVVMAALVGLVGGITLYARQEIIRSTAFGDRAVDAIHQPALQRVVAREITVQAVEPSLPDLIAARPVIESAVRLLVGSQAFQPVLRLAAEHGRRLVFERSGGNAVFAVADAGTVVASALRTLAPKIARELPKRSDAILLTLRRRSFADETLRVADHVRILGIVLPFVALALFVAAIAIAPVRRAAITRTGIAIGLTALVFAIVLELFRRYVVSHVTGTGELTPADVRGAVGELWGAYLGDLMTWALGFAAAGWLLAAASASLLAPFSSATGRRWLRTLARPPASTGARAARGALALALGALAIVRPGFVLEAVVVLAGCVLVYAGTSELLSLAAPAEPRVRRPRWARRRRTVLVAVGAGVGAAVVAGFAFTGRTSKVSASSIITCNGYAQLCDRRLNEVVFAGTHNSMSAANSRGWLIANQDRDVAQQLQDGIRLLKISTHYAVPTVSGLVSTDIAAEGDRLNRVSSKLTPVARAALQRLSRNISRGSTGTRDIYLCHTLCELGATRMVDFLGTIRKFLEVNPDQVIVLFDEDYVSERDLRSAFKRAGLFRYLARLQLGEELPTLRELIRSHHNVVVFAQKPPSGRYAWNMDAFHWIQDTPLGATKPQQFTCKLERGELTNPLLMMNNWADVFPPRPSPNVALVKRPFLLARARECVAQRGRVPNLILTDYYNRGDVIGAVAELNGVAGVRPAETEPVGGAP